MLEMLSELVLMAIVSEFNAVVLPAEEVLTAVIREFANEMNRELALTRPLTAVMLAEFVEKLVEMPAELVLMAAELVLMFNEFVEIDSIFF